MTTSNNFLYFFGVALVGIVSAAGMFLVEHYRQERRRHVMTVDLARIDQQLSFMRKELEQLKQLQKNRSSTPARKKSNRSSFGTSTVDGGDDSTTEVDSSDLEFYDLSDDEEISSPLDEKLREIDDKLTALDLDTIKEGLCVLTDLLQKWPDNPEILWRIGKAHHNIALGILDVNIKREHIRNGMEACQKAIGINSKICEAHKWCGLLVGYRACFAPIKEKVADGYLFRQYIESALALSPNDGTLHHMLGRFAYETASLTWYVRKLASTFFAEPPNHTYDEALEYFLAAEKLTKKDWKENKLFIAQCQIGLGKYENAVSTLIEADGYKNDSLDNTIDEKIKTLLEKYGSYK